MTVCPPNYDSSMTADDVDALRARVLADINRRAGRLVEVSRTIHAQPELAFAEHRAHDLLAGELEAAGLTVERRAFGLETAFQARAGTSGPTVAVCLEYDALPGLGHGCGHNIIAAAGLGAAIAVAAVADEAGGRVVALGTPAEEGGGGKVIMLDRGAFDGIDAAMMIHPADRDLTRIDSIAVAPLIVTYHGRAAHAAAAPHLGRNALDAAVLGYMNVAALRQHILPTERIHGVFTEAGDKANIVPARAEAEWFVRSPTLESLEPLKARVVACLRAGADAAGCDIEIVWSETPYAHVADDAGLLELYCRNAALLGRVVEIPGPDTKVSGSTDMGNVSQLVPSIHPMVQAAPPGTAIHTSDFAVHAAGPMGDAAVLDGARAMALTIIDIWAARAGDLSNV